MKISTATGLIELPSLERASEVGANEAPAPTPVPSGEGAAPALESAILQPALAAMRDMPEIDHAKVASLRDALAKGEIPFNAVKLAGLIQRFHGNDK